MLISPMVVPEIIVAIGIYFALRRRSASPTPTPASSWRTRALAVPFVVVTVLATLSGFDVNLIRASASLGADPVTTFRRVMLPMILPGVIRGASSPSPHPSMT